MTFDPERKIDERSGKNVVHEWAKHIGLHPNSWQSQRRRYADALAVRCVAQSLRLGETEGDLWERLVKAGEMLNSIRFACAPTLVRKNWWSDKVPDDERAEFEKLNEIVWVRRDPKSVHDLGYDESGYGGVDRPALASCAAEYLERQWLRVPTMDWALVDAFVTDELAQYGEHLKATHLPGPKDMFERLDFDRRTKGNVAAIRREGRKYRARPFLLFLGYQVLLPAILIGTALWFNATRTALIFAGLTVFDYALFVFRRIVAGFRRMRMTPEQLRTPMQVDYERFSAMLRVWRLLEGPVVNPTLLRAQMAKTTEMGAVWDSTAWAIVDRAIGIDPAVWITSFPS